MKLAAGAASPTQERAVSRLFRLALLAALLPGCALTGTFGEDPETGRRGPVLDRPAFMRPADRVAPTVPAAQPPDPSVDGAERLDLEPGSRR